MNKSLFHVVLLVLGTIITALPAKDTTSRNARQVGQELVFPTDCVTPLAPTPVTQGTGTTLLPANCGAIGDRIIGGDELPVRSYMWMALIGFGHMNDPDWGCGGSLISQRYVITAAHCADKSFTQGRSIVRVRLGEHDIGKAKDCQQFNSQPCPVCAPSVQDFSPENITIHPDWNKGIEKYSNDIALIRLDRPATFHGYVQPICLPPSNLIVSTFLNGREAEVAGWGKTENSSGSDVRIMVKLPFVSLENCRTVNTLPLLDKGQVCFGGVKGKDSCAGDSGGPLVSPDRNLESTNLFVLLGVVSYGPRSCGSENKPAVYTDVAQYRKWIESKLMP